jgi:hypothetical protein
MWDISELPKSRRHHQQQTASRARRPKRSDYVDRGQVNRQAYDADKQF